MSYIRALNWKETVAGIWTAHASRRVGGRYLVERVEGWGHVFGRTGVIWFEVRRLINTGPGAWNNPTIGAAKTFDDAKAVAEADHRRRLEQSA